MPRKLAALLLTLLSVFELSARAANPCTPLPPATSAAFASQLQAFLDNHCYQTWKHDPKIRTHRWVHPYVQVYCSPTLWSWLIAVIVRPIFLMAQFWSKHTAHLVEYRKQVNNDIDHECKPIAKTKTTEVKIISGCEAECQLQIDVSVTNNAGYSFPSGVGFRHTFLDLRVMDRSQVAWHPETSRRRDSSWTATALSPC